MCRLSDAIDWSLGCILCCFLCLVLWNPRVNEFLNYSTLYNIFTRIGKRRGTVSVLLVFARYCYLGHSRIQNIFVENDLGYKELASEHFLGNKQLVNQYFLGNK